MKKSFFCKMIAIFCLISSLYLLMKDEELYSYTSMLIGMYYGHIGEYHSGD